jgi:hypothetical protein
MRIERTAPSKQNIVVPRLARIDPVSLDWRCVQWDRSIVFHTRLVLCVTILHAHFISGGDNT